MLNLNHLSIQRIAIHSINARSADRTLVQPTYAEELTPLPADALDMFNQRIQQALGHKSHGIQVDFQSVGAGSFFQRAAEAMHAENGRFLELSAEMADALASAQLSKDLAASKLVVFSGVEGRLQRPFLAVVKAEMQDGLVETQRQRRVVIEHLSKIFLTETQRLYKIGFVQAIVGNPRILQNGGYSKSDFHVHLFDHVMTGTETRGAAMYFYNAFMGADVAASSKKLTQDFYEKTTAFLDSLDLPAHERFDFIDSLRTELRSNQQTILVSEFADRHLPRPMRAKYSEFMTEAQFPQHAIHKDTQYIDSKLRRPQRMKFSSGVVITTPPDRLRDLVQVDNSRDGVTVVTIQGTIESSQ